MSKPPENLGQWFTPAWASERLVELFFPHLGKNDVVLELPVAIMSQCWCTCNARSLMAFLSLRTHDSSAAFVSHPQAEIEEVARQMESQFAELFPITYKSWVSNGRVAP